VIFVAPGWKCKTHRNIDNASLESKLMPKSNTCRKMQSLQLRVRWNTHIQVLHVKIGKNLQSPDCQRCEHEKTCRAISTGSIVMIVVDIMGRHVVETQGSIISYEWIQVLACCWAC